MDDNVVVLIGLVPAGQRREERVSDILLRKNRPGGLVAVDNLLNHACAIGVARGQVTGHEVPTEQLFGAAIEIGLDAVEDQHAAQIVAVEHRAIEMIGADIGQRVFNGTALFRNKGLRDHNSSDG